MLRGAKTGEGVESAFDGSVLEALNYRKPGSPAAKRTAGDAVDVTRRERKRDKVKAKCCSS